MSLQEKDCKPGVEVICINSKFPEDMNPLNYFNQWLKVGSIYTIREVLPEYKSGKLIIKLNEIIGYVSDCTSKEYAHWPWRFKKLNPKDIQVFYDMLSKPVDMTLLAERIGENA